MTDFDCSLMADDVHGIRISMSGCKLKNLILWQTVINGSDQNEKRLGHKRQKLEISRDRIGKK